MKDRRANAATISTSGGRVLRFELSEGPQAVLRVAEGWDEGGFEFRRSIQVPATAVPELLRTLSRLTGLED